MPSKKTFYGMWDMASNGRFNPIAVRQIKVITNLYKKNGVGAKRDLQLLFDLSGWGQLIIKSGATLPSRSIRKHLNDEELWQILKHNHQVSSNAIWWSDLNQDEIRKLELRLYHQWPDVTKIINGWNNQTVGLKRARLLKAKPINSINSMVKQLLAIPNPNKMKNKA